VLKVYTEKTPTRIRPSSRGGRAFGCPSDVVGSGKRLVLSVISGGDVVIATAVAPQPD